jgi:iron(III) transport system ATP-binding protein
MTPAAHGLHVAGLRKSYGRTPVLRGVDLTVAAGALTALIGRSGCGKTTLLRLVAGFDRPDAGTVAIGGRAVTAPGRHAPPEQRRIGYVTQEGNLFPHLTVAANIAFGLPWRARRHRRGVAELLELVGLDQRYANRPPHELSGGEQQRVALARALAPRPDIVLLDEPFSALDADLRVSTRRAVTAALAAVGATTVLVTHDQTEALSLATRVAVLRDGIIVQEDTPATLYRRPADPGIAAFLGELTEVPAVLRGDVADTVLGRVPLPRPGHGDGAVLLRPEQITLGEPGTGHIDAVALHIDFHGGDGIVRLRVDTPDGPLDITTRTPAHHLPTPGQRAGLRVSGAALDSTSGDDNESGPVQLWDRLPER